jgi:hypothetical protein
MSLERFHGKLLDGERVLIGRVIGQFGAGGHQDAWVGRLEVHAAGPPFLATNRPYRLAIDDGRVVAIFLTGVCADAPANPPVLAFRVCEAVPT